MLQRPCVLQHRKLGALKERLTLDLASATWTVTPGPSPEHWVETHQSYKLLHLCSLERSGMLQGLAGPITWTRDLSSHTEPPAQKSPTLGAMGLGKRLNQVCFSLGPVNYDSSSACLPALGWGLEDTAFSLPHPEAKS